MIAHWSAPRVDLSRILGVELEHDRFYVLDSVTTNLAAALIAGPFATAKEADAFRRDCNIGEDCDVVRAA